MLCLDVFCLTTLAGSQIWRAAYIELLAVNKGMHSSQAFSNQTYATHKVCCASKSALPHLSQGSMKDFLH